MSNEESFPPSQFILCTFIVYATVCLCRWQDITHLLEGLSNLSSPTPGRSSQSDTGQKDPADKKQVHGEKPVEKDICEQGALWCLGFMNIGWIQIV